MHAATCFGQPFSGINLDSEFKESLSIIREFRSQNPHLQSWINIPLVNETGRLDDVRLYMHDGSSTATAYGRRLPGVMAGVDWLSRQGFSVKTVRLAILLERDILRPHVDMYPSIRLLMPLNEDGNNFRHVFPDYCVCMRRGELWGVDPMQCHGAANMGKSQLRVMLIIDAAKSEDLPEWYCRPWTAVPSSSLFKRLPWTSKIKRAMTGRLLRRLRELSVMEVEQEWLFLPYEYEISPAQMYFELIDFCNSLAEAGKDRKAAREWRTRAKYWTQHNCICVPETKMRKAVAPEN